MSDTTPKQTSGLAIAGLVLGILAAVTSFLPIINNLSAVIAVIGGVLSAIALVGALRGKHTAKGLSIAGVVLAVVSFAVVLITQSAYSAALQKATSGASPVDASEQQEDATPAKTEANDDAEASNAGSETQKDYSSLAVGETVTLDNGVSVTVNSVQTGLENYDGSIMIGVNVTYKNDGEDNTSFSQYDWKGEDANGAQRSAAYYSKDDESLNSGTLSPGGTVTGNVYFDDGIVRVLYYDNMFNKAPTAGWVL